MRWAVSAKSCGVVGKLETVGPWKIRNGRGTTDTRGGHGRHTGGRVELSPKGVGCTVCASWDRRGGEDAEMAEPFLPLFLRSYRKGKTSLNLGSREGWEPESYLVRYSLMISLTLPRASYFWRVQRKVWEMALLSISVLGNFGSSKIK